MSVSQVNGLNFSLLLDEIESGSSGSLANVIRKLRENEVAAYKAHVGGPTGELIASFIAALDLRASEHNAEIEKTCSYHYQSFVDSTRELLDIQQNAESLERGLRTLNVELEVTVNKFSESCDKLAACKQTLDHVNQCIEAIQISLPILEQYSRIEQSIADGRYYHALKNLEDLEHSQLDLIRPFAFSEIIIHRIPKTRTGIKNASLGELTDFLEYIRKNSVILGAFAMQEAARSSGIDSEALVDTLATNGYKEAPQDKESNAESRQQLSVNPKVHQKGLVGINAEGLEHELEMLTQIVTAANRSPDNENELIRSRLSNSSCNTGHSKVEDLVDFGPVYRCLHIHSVLNERAEFERHYCTQRRKQCQLALSLSPNQQSE
ncbi:unnamed protein product [Heterobilharzia americana]|nr:unnamed protein product [Heterobilharzia americana]